MTPNDSPDNGQGSGQGSWLDGIPADLTYEIKGDDGQPKTISAREHPKLLEFKDKPLAEFAKSYLEGQKIISSRVPGLQPLPKDATPEQQADWEKSLRTMIGVPETPDKYDLKIGDKSDHNMVQWFKEAAHDVGLPVSKAQKLVDSYTEFANKMWAQMEAEAAEEQKKANAEAHKALLGIFKTEDQLKIGAEVAHRGFEAVATAAKIAPEKIKSFIEKTGSDPMFIEIFHAIGQTFKEDNFIDSGSHRSGPKDKDIAQRVYPGMNP